MARPDSDIPTLLMSSGNHRRGVPNRSHKSSYAGVEQSLAAVISVHLIMSDDSGLRSTSII
jgi:hypothetical protein